MDLLFPALLALLASSCVMTALWFRARSHDRADHVDVVWAYGVGLAAVILIAATAPAPTTWRAICVSAVAAGWSLRLGTQLLLRVRSLPEDGRYEAMKRAWGEHAWSRMFWFFQAQALWVVMFALPAVVAAQRTGPLDGWDLAGITVALIAVCGEAVADTQLHRFRSAATAGSVCDTGLWKWSRHPNYFFEWVFWFSWVAFSIGSDRWWLTLLGPAVMLLFLFRVTGIPWTELQALRSRGDAYRDYQKRTSAFFPWPPRASQGESS